LTLLVIDAETFARLIVKNSRSSLVSNSGVLM
jgi:hypothetical protein